MDTIKKYYSIKDAVNRCLEEVESGRDGMSDILSGYPSLDELTRGWHPRELIVLASRPGVGKTALGLHFARNAAVDFKIPTVYFSPELGAIELTKRLMMSESGVNALRGSITMSDEDWRQVESRLGPLTRAPLFMDDSTETTFEETLERMKEFITCHGARFFIIDSYHLLFSRREKVLQESSEFEAVHRLKSLKSFALEHSVAIMILTWSGRRLQKRIQRPTLADVDVYCPRAVEYADKILLLHRPDLMGFQMTHRERFEIIIAKNKTGEIGSVELIFDGYSLKITEPTDIEL